MKDIKDFIDYIDTSSQEVPTYAVDMLKKVPSDSVFLNFGFRQNKHADAATICPCLGFTYSHKIWVRPMSRYTNAKEMLWLQGFPSSFVHAVSKSKLKAQAGNSMSVNVVCAILEKLKMFGK